MMPSYKFTAYFENEVLRKRPYLKKELCIKVIESPLKVERQENNRYRFWASVKELEDRYLRVVTLEDQITIHNAFLDRSFKP
jgi:hypothetical protein